MVFWSVFTRRPVDCYLLRATRREGYLEFCTEELMSDERLMDMRIFGP